ncbi:MAG: SGNH/GDSL hydrolase family protein [Bryobacteraceae bacterium]|nr:SGNH/GDSL hydrolase family protein [Bryobacteraceae bacterium]
MSPRLCWIALATATLLLPADRWVASWAPSPSPQLADAAQMRTAKLVFENQTLRQTVHVSLGGEQVRVRLSNAFGKEKVRIGAARIGRNGPGQVLTFSGRPEVTIPADAIILSDPVRLSIPSGADLTISLYLPGPALGAGIHYAAQQTNQVGAGDQSAAAAVTGANPLSAWVYLAGVDVLAPATAFNVVTFGDSITDGARSTVDTNRRWPDVLASRLRSKKIGVVNAGIGGNRLLHDASPSNIRFGTNALARFERDVLAQPGVRYVILLEGINDLGHAGTSAPASETVTAEDLIAAMKQLIERAHQRGVKLIGATILPFEGTVFAGYYSAEKEAKRQAVNTWIRTGNAFDGVIDFDKVTRDPSNPTRLLAAYDGGDHLHPSDAGYRAMGEAIDLRLFR